MLYLLLAVVAASSYSLLFKLFACKDVDSLQAIAFNYLTATLLGIGLSLGNFSDGLVLGAKEWVMSAVMGVMFMAAFVLMARSTARVGVSVTTVAARVALVIPVVCSYLFLPNVAEPRWGAIVVILVALVLVIWQGGGAAGPQSRTKSDVGSFMLPVGVFILFGLNNFFVNWAQSGLPTQSAASQLSAAIFFSAAIASTLYYLYATPKRQFSMKAIVGGLLLGISNFFTTYCMILALRVLSGAVFFPIYHIGVVALVTTLGVFIFGERLSKRQMLGLVVAVAGIVAFFV